MLLLLIHPNSKSCLSPQAINILIQLMQQQPFPSQRQAIQNGIQRYPYQNSYPSPYPIPQGDPPSQIFVPEPFFSKQSSLHIHINTPIKDNHNNTDCDKYDCRITDYLINIIYAIFI